MIRMRSLVVRELEDFLAINWEREPLVAGISGGSDSLALLFALEELGVKAKIAHVDHGWREESRQEAKWLEELVGDKFSFHTRRLERPTKNLEGNARAARLEFFGTLGSSVLLAHHGGDVAETLIERVVKGAPLVRIGGIRPVSQVGKLKLLRPFLALSREQLREYVKGRGVEPIEDKSNQDPRFFRAKIRHEILPRLGRPVHTSLMRLSREAHEMASYLDEIVAPLLERTERGPFGSYLEVGALHPVERRHLIRCFCENEGICLSREGLDRALVLVERRRANTSVDGKLWIDRGRVFVMRGKVRWELVMGHQAGHGWQAAWRGAVTTYVRDASCSLEPAPSLSHLYTADKVPAFFGKQLPVLHANGQMVGTFLSKGEGKIPVTLRLVPDSVKRGESR